MTIISTILIKLTTEFLKIYSKLQKDLKEIRNNIDNKTSFFIVGDVNLLNLTIKNKL